MVRRDNNFGDRKDVEETRFMKSHDHVANANFQNLFLRYASITSYPLFLPLYFVCL